MSVLLRLGMDFAVFVSMSDATAFYLDYVAPTTGPPPASAPLAVRRTRRAVEARDEAISQAFSALPDDTNVLLTPRDQVVIDTIDHQRGLIAQRTAKRVAELTGSSSSTPSTPPRRLPSETPTIFEQTPRRIFDEFADACSPNTLLLCTSHTYDSPSHSRPTSSSSSPRPNHLLRFATLAEYDNGSPIIQNGTRQRISTTTTTNRSRQDLQRDSGTGHPSPRPDLRPPGPE